MLFLLVILLFLNNFNLFGQIQNFKVKLLILFFLLVFNFSVPFSFNLQIVCELLFVDFENVLYLRMVFINLYLHALITLVVLESAHDVFIDLLQIYFSFGAFTQLHLQQFHLLYKNCFVLQEHSFFLSYLFP